ncbi:MAG: hypothetical protein E7665_07265 [Ruminococcaceae bacterium]|nr:hypothetical protein [Oscillospiraceae bacterium]
MNGISKKCFFYFDDVIWLFRDLTRYEHDSVFDHFYLKYFKEAHERYGFKAQMNVFYRTDYFYGTDEFTLREMTDKYKDEWEKASEWLKFGFHSLQEFPDYPLINASYESVKKDLLLTKNEVLRFAGENSFSKAVCSHWRPISRDGCRALADNGIILINSTEGETREYDGDPSSLPYGHAARLMHNRQPETRLYTRTGLNKAIARSLCAYNHISPKELEETAYNLKTVYNEELKVHFKCLLTYGNVVNLSTLEEMEKEYEPTVKHEFAGIGGHEQYFYPDYYAYQKDHGEKLLKACEIMYKNGYEFIFAQDIPGFSRA